MNENTEQESDNPFASANPYQVSTQYSVGGFQFDKQPYQRKSLPWIFGKWFLVCYLCAIPSFFFGLMLTEATLGGIVGMVVGIFCYVVGYTLVECTAFVQRALQDRIFRRAVRIGYITRVIFSAFPVLAPLDMYLGFLSTFGGSAVLGALYPSAGNVMNAPSKDLAPMTIFSFCTTIIQGALMNVVLLGFVAIVYGVCCLVMEPSKRRTGGAR
ncbi:MAG: hypothetical protein ACPIA2_13320 [Mariniblastus sp.]